MSGEVLRQCSAANPADIYVPSVHSLWMWCSPIVMTVLYRLKKNTHFIFQAVIDTAVCTRMCILLTPHEYYMILPAFVINAAFQPRFATSALHTASFT